MASCNICLEGFKQPVSLPCGHIFCTECIIKTVQAIRPIRTVHSCPMCRASYNIAPINPLALPPHLRPFITPTIRRVFIDAPEQSENPSSSIPPNVAEELARLRTENQALKSHCTLWRRRAEVHGAATLGLLDFARVIRDQAASLARERDDWARQCHHLKRKLDEYGQPLQPKFGHCPESSSSSFTFSFPLPGHSRNTPPPPFPSSPPSTSDPSASVEASRLAAAALFDFPPCMSHPNASHHPQYVDLGPWSRQLGNISGPSFAASSSSLPTGATASSTGSVSGISPAQTSLEQPPTKRARRDSAEVGHGHRRRTNRLPVLGSSSGSRVPS